jgi:cytoskeletal protein RodZ
LQQTSTSYVDEQTAATSSPGYSRWLWLAAVIVALLLGYTLGHLGVKGTTPTPQATTTPNNQTAQNSQTTQNNQTAQNSQTTQNSQATPDSSLVAPAQPVVSSAPVWTTVSSYHSSGNRQTQVFTAPKSWNLQWQCNPASNSSKQYNLVVAIYNADGTLVTPAAINTICKAGNVTDMVLENLSGKIYLDVFSQGEWTLNVQQLK